MAGELDQQKSPPGKNGGGVGKCGGGGFVGGCFVWGGGCRGEGKKGGDGNEGRAAFEARRDTVSGKSTTGQVWSFFYQKVRLGTRTGDPDAELYSIRKKETPLKGTSCSSLKARGEMDVSELPF